MLLVEPGNGVDLGCGQVESKNFWVDPELVALTEAAGGLDGWHRDSPDLGGLVPFGALDLFDLFDLFWVVGEVKDEVVVTEEQLTGCHIVPHMLRV